MVTALPHHFEAIRLISVNTQNFIGVNSIVAKASVLSSIATDADINNSNGTWVNVTQSNQLQYCVPIAPGLNRIVYEISDQIPLKSIPRTDGGTLPLLAIRVYIANTNSLPVYGQGFAPDVYGSWTTNPNGQVWFARHQDGDAITNPTLFTDTINRDQSPIVGFQFSAVLRMVKVMCVGDSIYDGIGTRRGEGFGMLVCNMLNAEQDQVGFSYSNCGWSGQSTASFTKRAIDIVNSPVKPDILFFPTGSPNDVTSTITSSIIQSQASLVHSVIQECKQNGVKLVLCTWLPSNSNIKNYGATDSLRVQANIDFMNKSGKDFVVVDTSTALTGQLVGGQYQMLAGTTTDDIHPNDNGNQIIANLLKPIVKYIVGI